MVILWNSSGNLEESMQPIGPSIQKVFQKCSERSTPWMVLQGSCVDEDVQCKDILDTMLDMANQKESKVCSHEQHCCE